MSELIYKTDAISALGEKPLAWTEGEYELGLQNQWESDVESIEEILPVSTSRHNEFVKGLDDMFDTIYDCEIEHPVFQDTVREIIDAVIELYDTLHPASKGELDG